MKNNLALFLICIFLSACISLPENPQGAAHYQLLPVSTTCKTNNQPAIRLNLTKVNAKLNSNRLAHINQDSGEIKYLQGVNWPAQSRDLIEQQLAFDLEQSGFTVVTSHHQTADMASLVCELRAFQIEATGSQHEGRFNMSCRYKKPSSKQYKNIITSNSTALERFSRPTAIKALSNSYEKSYNQLCTALLND